MILAAGSITTLLLLSRGLTEVERSSDQAKILTRGIPKVLSPRRDDEQAVEVRSVISKGEDRKEDHDDVEGHLAQTLVAVPYRVGIVCQVS